MNKIKEINVITDKQNLQQVKPELDQKKDSVTVVDDNDLKKVVTQNSTTSTATTNRSTSPTTSTIGMTENEGQIDAVIEPQDQETIKYLSNVKHHETGEISKPFTIGDQNYQMVRGIKPNREIILGVMCLDGSKKIHGIADFEKNIAMPMKRSIDEEGQTNEKFVDHLNLADGNGFKHFFVNIHTGDVTDKFKSTKDMLKSGRKLGPDEDYMDAKQLKKFRYNNYFKNSMNEEEENELQGTNIEKLKTDVKKLSQLISNKFSTAISKIDKPVEQVEFLTQMADMIGVPFNKLTSLINNFKDVAKQQQQTKVIPMNNAEPKGMAAESKVIKKDTLLESLGVKQTIIKVNKK